MNNIKINKSLAKTLVIGIIGAISLIAFTPENSNAWPVYGGGCGSCHGRR